MDEITQRVRLVDPALTPLHQMESFGTFAAELVQSQFLGNTDISRDEDAVEGFP